MKIVTVGQPFLAVLRIPISAASNASMRECLVP
jgi:hypothetical protein